MRRALAALLAVALVTAATTGSAFAADPVVVSMDVDAPGGLTVGDHLRYVIRVEADRGTTITLAPDGLPAFLQSTERPDVQTRAKGDRVELTMTLALAAFAPGRLDVPPIKLRYRGAGTAQGVIETPPSVIVVESVLPASGSIVPRDLKPQLEIGTPPAGNLLAVLVALVVALVLAVTLLAMRLRRKPRLVIEPEPVLAALGPEDRARARLDAAGSAFAAKREYDTYYAEIAMTVRNYLTERFGFAAFAMTTRELTEAMPLHGIDRWQARLVTGLLTQCDAVVFAGYRPAVERADTDLTAAYEIVEMSRPAPQPVEAVQEAAVR